MVAINLQSLPHEVSELCEEYHVRRLSVFGSAVRGELRADSDVDLLAEFESAHTPSYFEIIDLADRLSPLFGDRRIDLVTRKSLHHLIRDDILSQAKVLYEG
jgi:predicted nucleotidyltransferase